MESSMNLTTNEVDIWEIPLVNTFADLDLATLAEDEITRYQRFLFPKHKVRFALARIALRRILGNYLNTPPQEIEFSYSSHGKPMLKSNCNLQFNLSHSQDLALLAVTQQHPIGIDVEYFSPRPYLGIAEHLFSQAEIAALEKLSAAFTPWAFFSVWAQKEALIKAVGLGLSYPTKNLTVPLMAEPYYLIEDTYSNVTWKIASFMPYHGVSAAVCYHPSLTLKRYFIYDFTKSKGHLAATKISLKKSFPRANLP